MITILAKSISKMTNDEIKQKLLSWPPISELQPLINEAHKRNDQRIFEVAARDPRIVSNPKTSHFIIKSINSNPTSTESEYIFRNLLNQEAEVLTSGKLITNLISLSSSDSKLAAIALLHNGTPDDVTISLFNKFHLNIVSHTYGGDSDIREVKSKNKAQDILSNTISLLEEGHSWDNKLSGTYILSRLTQNRSDKLLSEISKYDMDPEMGISFINASRSMGNKKMTDVLFENNNPGVEVSKLVANKQYSDPKLLIEKMTSLISSPMYRQYLEWIWEKLVQPNLNDEAYLDILLKTQIDGINLLMVFGEYSDEMFSKIIEVTVPKVENSHSYAYGLPSVHWMINKALADSTYQEKILNLPKELLSVIRLTPNNKEIVNQFFQHSDDTIEDLELLSNLNNWYNKHSNNS